jgi:hypothetical protein
MFAIGLEKMGVSLEFLEQFMAENEISKASTANEVVESFVRPQTKNIGGEGRCVHSVSDAQHHPNISWQWAICRADSRWSRQTGPQLVFCAYAHVFV